ncbi:formylglycine-generating enzyme family protein [Pseudomonadota bacterium]
MKKSLFSISIAAILASASVTISAGTVTIPNTFTAGTPAVADEVNANFTAVKGAVDDNAGDIATNTGNITTNTGAIATNTGNITTNTNAISVNTGNITTNTTAIGVNTSAISALQSDASCPSDMVAVGSLCVDKYESSLWTAATGGSQISPAGGAPFYPCAADGSDCGDGAANPIYARSEATFFPAALVTWYQANQACANVGKRLPTTAEWQMAASGTDETLCPSTGALVATGTTAACVSTAGALDMVENLWEWTADLNQTGADASTDDLDGRVLGSGYLSGAGTTKSLAGPPPTATNPEFGFRCVR